MAVLCDYTFAYLKTVCSRVGLSVLRHILIQKNDYVGVLLYSSRIAQVRKHRTLFRALLASACELGQKYDRNANILCHKLKIAGDIGNLEHFIIGM